MQTILQQQKSLGSSGAPSSSGMENLKPVLSQLISSIDKMTRVIIGQTKVSGKIGSGSTNASLNKNIETETEDARFKDKEISLLEIIAHNTATGKDTKVKKDTDSGEIGGGFAAAIAVIGGAFVGLVTAWAKTIKLFFGGAFAKIVKLLKSVFGEGTVIGKIITSIKTAIVSFLAPLIKGFKSLTSRGSFIGKMISGVVKWVKGFGEFFKGIGSKLGWISKMFGAVSKLVSKIAYPLIVIMAVWDTIKGAMAGWAEGGLVGAIGGAIKGLFNSLIGGIADMLKGAVSWIASKLGFTAVEEFLDSFSFKDLFGAFVDALLYIPKAIQKIIMNPMESLKALTEKLSAIWKPISEIMGTLVDAFMQLPNELFNLITEYIVDPLKEVFKPVTAFFKNIANKVLGFFEDFGIPEIGFDALGMSFKAGPWYPFRPDEDETRIASKTDVAKTSGGGGRRSISNKNTITSGASKFSKDFQGDLTKEEMADLSADKTRVMSSKVRTESKDGVDTQVLTRDLAEFDPRTGKARISGTSVGDREISKRAFSKIKDNAKENGDQSKIIEIIKEDDAYQKLSWFDRRKVDVGYDSASNLLAAQEPSQADTVISKSAENDSARQDRQPSSNTNMVSAPTTIANNQNITQIKAPIRNQDSTQHNYMLSKYVR